MKILAKTAEMSRAQWLELRRMGIGGSDVSVIAGINPFKSVHELWLEKTGQSEISESESEYAHFGTLLEPIIRKEFMERTGIKVRQKHMTLQSDDYPFMICDLDGVITEDGKFTIFEAKTASAYKQDLWEEEVPAQYVLQVQHYMAVTGAKKTYIAALVGGNHFYYHVVERDDEMIEKIIAMEKHFWETYVVGGVEPIPDGSKATTEYFANKFANSNGETITLPDEMLAICEEYERLSGEVKRLEEEKDAAANHIKSYLKEAEKGVFKNADKTVTWKKINKTSVDAKRLKTERPEIYSDFSTQSSYRRFQVA